MTPPAEFAQEHDQLLEVVRAKGYQRRDEAFQLASGEYSHDFIDAKAALSHGRDLTVACDLMLKLVAADGIEFDAVGGLTMGADHFSHGIALLGQKHWFVVRKAPKGRGTNQLIEGTAIGQGTRVLLVDDVVTTGGSILKAYDAVQATGAQIVAATTLVDRGDRASRDMQDRDVPYYPVITYSDLGIEPVGQGTSAA
ncbi:orotate phosphoribosyltransferase [Euzebya tangerina]|uniref:orotate phosphoribosyltransferase n=1 Tax=Euzebya tangerina TaxID=591198 RepID=UPI00196A65DA|nr:orotate phosphoribosyltransferase [Euzebya tangerina]